MMSFLTLPEVGGIDVFIGTTRQWTEGKETHRLEYEAYTPMAKLEIERLIQSAVERWEIERVYVSHRLGLVPVAEASVIIGVAAAHRDAAFIACRFLIDSLKKTVPIWKKEYYADGTSEWVDPRSV